jgi:hypothetical protein
MQLKGFTGDTSRDAGELLCTCLTACPGLCADAGGIQYWSTCLGTDDLNNASHFHYCQPAPRLMDDTSRRERLRRRVTPEEAPQEAPGKCLVKITLIPVMVPASNILTMPSATIDASPFINTCLELVNDEHIRSRDRQDAGHLCSICMFNIHRPCTSRDVFRTTLSCILCRATEPCFSCHHSPCGLGDLTTDQSSQVP